MKLNRFVAMAALTLLVVGAMGVVTVRTFAQSPTPPATQGQVPAAQDDEADAATQGPDTDTQDVQEGPQNGPDTGTDAEAEGSSDGQDAAPLGTPAITADVAQATAEKYLNAGTASQVELDDENGQLVYSVEINGTDVKVDAMTGSVLGAESGAD